MNQYDFDQVLRNYIAGTHTAAEETLIQEYLENNPMNETPVLEDEREVIGNRIRKKLFANTVRTPVRWLQPWVAGIAASFLLIVGGWYFFSTSGYRHLLLQQFSGTEDGVVVIKNTSSKPHDVPLEDGSVVTLKSHSSISFPEHFGTENRLVYLHGEAFFKIKRNPDKPFIVSTGNLMTQVLGTSFNIKSYDDAKSIEVRVATGRVSVYEKNEVESKNSNGVILTPNQRITFDKKSRKMELSIVDRPMIISKHSATENPFAFNDVPFRAAIATLEKAYGIDIVIESNIPETCLFNGDLTDLPMFEQLELVCKSVNATFDTRGTTVFVHGAGCAP